MTKRLNDLRHQRSQLVDQARGILAKAETEKRGLTAEEQGQYDKIFADQEQLRGTIEAEQRQVELERSLAGTQLNEQRTNDGNPDDGPDGTGRDSKAYRAAFRSLLLNGRSGLTGDQLRALSADVSPQGGYTIAPTLFVDSLLKFVDDEVFIRRYATKYKIKGYSSLGAPSLDNDPADADWTSEIATGAEDSTMSFGKREMLASPLAKRL